MTRSERSHPIDGETLPCLGRGIVILGLTAYAMKGEEEKVLATGCDGYIAKPIDTRRFPSHVAAYPDSTR
jgi:CheY-like chemotaxis protein